MLFIQETGDASNSGKKMEHPILFLFLFLATITILLAFLPESFVSYVLFEDWPIEFVLENIFCFVYLQMWLWLYCRSQTLDYK